MQVDKAVLTVRDFGLIFGERTILRSVSFALASRGCTVLLGPSGTGKSALLRTLAGFNEANPSCRTWGEATFGDYPIGQRAHPSLVMQKSTLLVSDVFENLVAGLPNRSTYTRLAQVALVTARLERYGQSRFLGALSIKVAELTVDDQRLIAILRLTMSDPALLMADEPTTGLTAAGADAVLNLLSVIAQERAVLVVLHHLQQARQIASQVLLLANGRVEEMASGDSFFSAPVSDAAIAFLRTGSCPEDAHVALSENNPVDTSARPLSGPQSVASAARGPNGFRWLLPGQVGGAPRPGIVHDISYDLAALRAVGVTQLISLAEESVDETLARDYGITWTMNAMPDMHPPSMAQAVGLYQQIDAFLQRDEVVTVHCHAGLGRTGTVLAGYWLWKGQGKESAVHALEHVRRIEGRWVQSEEQVRFLEEFAPVVASMASSMASHHNTYASHAVDEKRSFTGLGPT